jgi:TM2 domain-containing membrane protein YozV
MSDVHEVQNVQKAGLDEKYCSSCGSIIKKEAVFCPKCGVQQKSLDGDGDISTKWLIVLLLHIFLGMFGGAHFYAGKTGRGILMLILSVGGFIFTFVFIGFAAIAVACVFWILDLVKILTGKYTDAQGQAITQNK